MTESTTEGLREFDEVEIQLPDEFAEIAGVKSEITSQVTTLRKIESDIDSIQPEEIEDIGMVADRVSDLESRVIESSSAEELEEIYGDLEDAITSPYIQHAEESYESILSELELNLSDDRYEDVLNNYQSQNREKIRSTSEALGYVEEKLGEMSEVAKDALGNSLQSQDRVTTSFKLPKDELKPTVDRYVRRSSSIDEISEEAGNYDQDWSDPLRKLPDNKNAYQGMEDELDVDRILEYIQHIDTTGFDNIPIDRIIRSDINSSIDEDVSELESCLNEILDQVNDLDNEVAEKAEGIISHDAADTGDGGREESVMEKYEEVCSPSENSSLDELESSLSILNTEIGQWARDMANTLSGYAEAHSIIEENYDTGDFDADPSLELSSDIDRNTVAEQPSDALSLYEEFSGWIEDLEDSGSQGSDAIGVSLLIRLVQDEEVPIESVKPDSLDELSDALGKNLVVTYRHGKYPRRTY
jgi:hypothetical protein